jgi:hypothetical protein
VNIAAMRRSVAARRGGAENLVLTVIGMMVMTIPATARADVAPGPVEFSMFAFMWAVTTLLLGGAIYLAVTRIRGDGRAIEHANEVPAPRVWKLALFRRSVAVAGAIAFVGWLAASSWLLQENRRARDEQRMKMWIERQERAVPSAK